MTLHWWRKVERRRKKPQHSAGFEPATSRLCSVCSTTVLQLWPKSPKSCFANRCSFVCRRLGHHLRGPDQVRVGPLLGHFRSLLHGSALRPLQVKPMPLPVAETCWAGAVIFCKKIQFSKKLRGGTSSIFSSSSWTWAFKVEPELWIFIIERTELSSASLKSPYLKSSAYIYIYFLPIIQLKHYEYYNAFNKRKVVVLGLQTQ